MSAGGATIPATARHAAPRRARLLAAGVLLAFAGVGLGALAVEALIGELARTPVVDLRLDATKAAIRSAATR